MTRRCGHHPAQAFDKSHARAVEHERLACEDCRAIQQARENFHGTNCTEKKCLCDDEMFWISERIPIPSQ